MNSLRTRLLLGTLAIVAIIWCALVAGAWREARHETDELFDAHLAETAALLVAFSSHEAEEIQEHLPSHPYARKVAFQIWQGGTHLLVRSANAPDVKLSALDEGFSDAESGGKSWRVFGVWDSEHRYLAQVAETREARADVGRELAVHLLAPLAIALPLLALALVLLIRTSLQPLSRLAEAISQRTPSHLEPLVLSDIPSELYPVLDRLNALLKRLDDSLAQERRLTADAAHELRTPLAALRAHAQVAQGAQDEAERGLALSNVIAATDRAAHLVEQLLILRRLDASRFGDQVAPCDLRGIAVAVLADMTPMALERNVELCLLDGPSPMLSGDANMLAILLRNLLDNAVRYSPPQTQVEVVIGQTESGCTLLDVCDQGPGIPQSERESALKRFVRTPSAGGESGAGLGLSIVTRIAELHGAEVSLNDGGGGKGLRVEVIFKAME